MAMNPAEVIDSIQKTTKKKVSETDSKKEKNTPEKKQMKQQNVVSQSILPTDSIVDNLLENDSIAATEVHYGLILEPETRINLAEREDSDTGFSFVTLGLILMFCIVAFRFHNNRRFVGALLRNLLEVKERNNAFDDTVRETSFVIFLNLLWCASGGVLLFRLLQTTSPAMMMSPEWFSSSAIASGMGICMGVAVLYTLFMTCAYLTVGNIFSDGLHASLWLRGFGASQGIMSLFYLPLALACLCYPGSSKAILWIAAIIFILARTIFIWKGLRIFFTQISSWMLFLYYLCSLEIVPLILTYFTACILCGA